MGPKKDARPAPEVKGQDGQDSGGFALVERIQKTPYLSALSRCEVREEFANFKEVGRDVARYGLRRKSGVGCIGDHRAHSFRSTFIIEHSF